ncbi:hypothetical protein V7134_31220, partial [Priestia megaterium]|uniref:hypothetical protein n=1 Tax=Priestia megaterium TaxID=1404 RepID=UPI002FFF381B
MIQKAPSQMRRDLPIISLTFLLTNPEFHLLSQIRRPGFLILSIGFEVLLASITYFASMANKIKRQKDVTSLPRKLLPYYK